MANTCLWVLVAIGVIAVWVEVDRLLAHLRREKAVRRLSRFSNVGERE
jgi:hypothetical protein